MPTLGCTEEVLVDRKAFDQVHNVARMSFIYRRVAVMRPTSIRA